MKETLTRFARERTEVLALGLIVVVALGLGPVLAGRSAPSGIYALGVVTGAGLALHAVGMVLVYRSNRVINFAQLQMGFVGGLLFVNLANRRSFIRGLDKVCPPCVPDPRTVGDLVDGGALEVLSREGAVRLPDAVRNLPLSDPAVQDTLPQGLSLNDLDILAAPGWMEQANFWLSALSAVLLTAVLVLAVYVLIIRRFNQAPKLILTVATLGAGRFAVYAGTWVSEQLFPEASDGEPTTGAVPIPIDVQWNIDDVVLRADHIFTVVAALVAAVGLLAFFRYIRVGVVLRGAAENPQRAETLGVNVTVVTARAWILAGVLSGVAAVLAASSVGAGSNLGEETLVRVLAAVVVGGLVSLPLAVAGSFAIGLMDNVVSYVTDSPPTVSGLLLGVVVVLLLAQRARASRAELDAEGSWLASREIRPIPAELRHLPPVRATIRTLTVLGVLVALGYPWFMSPAQTNLTVVYMLYAIIGLSLLILTGWAGQISLAQMAIAALGAYLVAVLKLPILLGLPVAALVGAVAAVVLGLPALRLRGQHLAIVTLAFAVAVSNVLLGPTSLGKRLTTSVQRPVFLGIDLEDDRSFFYFTLVFVLLATIATVGLRRGPIGRHLIACKDNEAAAQSFSLDLVRARVTAFAISGVLASFAGALFVYSQRGLEPASFAPDVSIRLFLMVLIGGLGSVAGALLGAAYLALTSLISFGGLGGLLGPLVDPGLAVVVVLLFAPGGLCQVVFGMRDAWLRRLASRYRIDVPSLVADRRVDQAAAVPVRPRERPGGGTVDVPPVYRLDEQWMVLARKKSERKVSVDG